MCGDDQESPSRHGDIGTTPEEYPFPTILRPVDFRDFLSKFFFPDDTFMEEIIQVNCFHLNGKRCPAATGSGGIGIYKLKTAGEQIGGEIDCHALEIKQGLQIHSNLYSVIFINLIKFSLFFVPSEIIVHTRASAARD